MEFEPVEAIVPETVTCNFAAARKHVGEIELEIRVIKERERSTITTLPFKKCPCRVIIELVYFVVLWRNVILTWETGTICLSWIQFRFFCTTRMFFNPHTNG